MQIRGYGGPTRYIQGPDTVSQLGANIARLGDKPFLLMDPYVEHAYGSSILQVLATAGLNAITSIFGGECTDAEVARCVECARDRDVVVGLGGGKTLDTSKIVARELDSRLVTVPTVASTDSPTSSIGIVYTPSGTYERVERCYRNPDLVLVDSTIIVRAPVRHFVAGIGDALSTWFEARSNVDSRSNNCVADGYEMTIAGFQIARACHERLMRDGRAAYRAVQVGCLTEAVENIIEANILLSGLGFENCGVSGAHGIHDALTVLPATHPYLHGEKVAFGIIPLLLLENRDEAEIQEVIRFCMDIGLPTRLCDIGLSSVADADLMRVGEVAMQPGGMIHSIPRELDARHVADAIRAADITSTAMIKGAL